MDPADLGRDGQRKKGGKSYCLRLSWTLVMAAVAATSTYAYITPQWIDAGDTQCGVIKFCNDTTGCTWPYENYGNELSDIPGQYWQIGSVCMAAGTALTTLMALTSLITLCAPTYEQWVHNVFTLGGVLLFVGDFLIMIGFKDQVMGDANTTIYIDAPKDNCRICGLGSGPFVLESGGPDAPCAIGFSLILGLASAFGSGFASVLGHFVVARSDDKKDR